MLFFIVSLEVWKMEKGNRLRLMFNTVMRKSIAWVSVLLVLGVYRYLRQVYFMYFSRCR